MPTGRSMEMKEKAIGTEKYFSTVRKKKNTLLSEITPVTLASGRKQGEVEMGKLEDKLSQLVFSCGNMNLALVGPSNVWKANNLNFNGLLLIPSKNTGVGCHAHLQGIFPTHGMNPDLPYCRQMFYWLSHEGKPNFNGKGSRFLMIGLR